MTDYYVDSVNGDDGNDGLTPTTAWQTLARASSTHASIGASFYGAGDVLYLVAGSTWTGEDNSGASLFLDTQGGAAAAAEFEIKKYGVGGDPHIDPDDTSVHGIELVDCGPVLVEQVEISGCATGIEHRSPGITTGPLIVADCIVHDCEQDGIHFNQSVTSATGSHVIRGNRIDACRRNGIHNDGAVSATYSGNRLTNIGTGTVTAAGTNPGNGIFITGSQTTTDDVQFCYFNRCLVGVNGRSGSTSLGTVSYVRWCYFVDCDDAAMRMDNVATNNGFVFWHIYMNVIHMSAVAGFLSAIRIGDHATTQDIPIVAIHNNTIHMETTGDEYAVWVKGSTAAFNVLSLLANVIKLASANCRFVRVDLNGGTWTEDYDENNYDGDHATAFDYDGSIVAFADWAATVSDEASSSTDPSQLPGTFDTAPHEAILPAGAPGVGIATDHVVVIAHDFFGRIVPASGAYNAGACQPQPKRHTLRI